jgi:hypothetical protein
LYRIFILILDEYEYVLFIYLFVCVAV